MNNVIKYENFIKKERLQYIITKIYKKTISFIDSKKRNHFDKIIERKNKNVLEIIANKNDFEIILMSSRSENIINPDITAMCWGGSIVLYATIPTEEKELNKDDLKIKIQFTILHELAHYFRNKTTDISKSDKNYVDAKKDYQVYINQHIEIDADMSAYIYLYNKLKKHQKQKIKSIEDFLNLPLAPQHQLRTFLQLKNKNTRKTMLKKLYSEGIFLNCKE